MSPLLVCCLLELCGSSPVAADYVIRRVTIHDGSGALTARVGDVAIRGERIVAIGEFQAQGTPVEIDGTGLIAAPGFIDLHNHSDSPIVRPATRGNLNYLLQGCTTIVTGNCGGGRVDVDRYLAEIAAAGAGTNVAHLIPQGDVRQQAMGNAKRPPTPDELRQMRELVEQGMQAGAFGMSTGLIYTPGMFADVDELTELARVVGKHGGFYASHIRNEGNRILEAIQEALVIGERAGVPVHISHFKVSGRSAWGLAPDAIQAVVSAREKGRRVTADQYPYIASSTSLGAMVMPDEVRTKEQLKAALADPAAAEKLRESLRQGLAARDGGKSLLIARYSPQESWQGRDLASLAAEQKRDAIDLVLEIQSRGGAQMVSFGMNEDEVRLIMRQSFMATASDGSAMNPDDTVPHPRSYGTFPRKIGRYAIEGQFLPLEQAIHSATGLPADILGLKDRGRLAVGNFADLVLFDPQNFRDTATFEKPHQYATGVRWVFVNGQPAVEQGKATGKLAGRPLRRAG